MSEETKEPLEETPVTADTAETEQEKTPENQEPEKKAKKKEKKEKKEKEMLFHISRFWYLSLIKLGGFNINTKVVKMFEICKKGNTEW